MSQGQHAASVLPLTFVAFILELISLNYISCPRVLLYGRGLDLITSNVFLHPSLECRKQFLKLNEV